MISSASTSSTNFLTSNFSASTLSLVLDQQTKTKHPLFRYVNIKQGELIKVDGKTKKLKDLKQGDTMILRNGKKGYKKNIKSNEGKFGKGDLITINNMSLNINYIREDERENFFFGRGVFVLSSSIRNKKCPNFHINILFNLMNNEYFFKSLKKKQKGSVQPFITPNAIRETIRLYFDKPLNLDNIEKIEKIREVDEEEKDLRRKLRLLEIKKKSAFRNFYKSFN